MLLAIYLFGFFYCAVMVVMAFHEFNKDPWCRWASLLPGMCGFAFFPGINLIIAFVAHYLFYIDAKKEKKSVPEKSMRISPTRSDSSGFSKKMEMFNFLEDQPPPPPPEPPPTRTIRDGAETKASKEATQAWRKRNGHASR